MGVQSSSRNVWNENFLFKGQRATAWEIRVKLYFQVCRNHDPYYKGSELLHKILWSYVRRCRDGCRFYLDVSNIKNASLYNLINICAI